MPSYLVGHGGALSPGAPGGNPVGNAISTAIAIDSQRLRQQQAETYAKQTAIAERGQKLRSLETTMDLLGTKTPQGMEAMHQYAKELGLDYDPGSTDPELVSNILTNGRKSYAKVAADPTLSDVAKLEKFGEIYFAAVDALRQYGGTKSEKRAAERAVGDLGRSMLKTGELGPKLSDYEQRQGLIQGRQEALSLQGHEQRLEEIAARPKAAGTKADPDRTTAMTAARGVLMQRLRDLKNRDDYKGASPQTRNVMEQETRRAVEAEYGVPLTYAAPATAAPAVVEAVAPIEITPEMRPQALSEAQDYVKRARAGNTPNDAILNALKAAGVPDDIAAEALD